MFCCSYFVVKPIAYTVSYKLRVFVLWVIYACVFSTDQSGDGKTHLNAKYGY